MTDTRQTVKRPRRLVFLVLAILAILAVALALYTSGYRGLRPASGTAVAMAEAAEPPAGTDQRRAAAQ